MASVIQAKTQAICQPPVSTSPPPPPPPPRKPNRRTSPGRTYVNVCIWLPRLLMVMFAIQSPRRPTWTNRRVRNPQFFALPGVDWCVTTINSSLTRRRVPKALLAFFCPTKPPISELSNPCMASMQASDHAPHQIKFDTDSQKFLIDSGASAHIWNRRKDFESYHVLSPQERKNDQVLGVKGGKWSLRKVSDPSDSISRMISTTSTQFIFTMSGTYWKPQSTSLSHKCSPSNDNPRETPMQAVLFQPTQSPSSGPAKMANKSTSTFP